MRLMWQTVADEIQVLEAARMWVTDSPERSQGLEAGIAHLKGICDRWGLKPDERQFNIEVLSKDLQRESEYKVMFKLSSKFVHPSAALVNGRLGSEDEEYANMFLIRSQEYALQLLAEAKDWFHLWSVPAQGGPI